MRVLVAAIGRMRAGVLKDLQEDYARRITAWPLTLRELEERRPLPATDLKEREGALLLDAVPKGATVVALDERGANLTSPQFSERLSRWQDAGVGDLAFLIGGADGHPEVVRRRAELTLSLGALTWPHLLARSLLLEQLYRAQQILAGHPYHRV